MKRFAVYVRVSTQDQFFERQISDIKAFIERENFGIDYEIDLYSENISGYKHAKSRPKLTKFLNKVEEDPKYYSCLYVTELSRLGRDPLQTRQIVNDLITQKIQICVTTNGSKMLDENGNPHKITIAVFQMLMEFADMEADTFKKRSRSGLLQSASVLGRAGGGSYYPYGYKKDADKKLVIDEDEAIIIKGIFDLYRQGNGCKKIAGYLNNRPNTPTRTAKNFRSKESEQQKFGFKWVDKTVNDIIRNPIYKGQRRYKGDKLDIDDDYDGAVIKRKGERFKELILSAPPIISAQLYDECIEIMETKTHRNYLTTYTYLLKDLLICGCCGRNYFAKFKPVEGGDKVYICSSRLKPKGNCGNIGVNISLLDSAIYNEIVNSPSILQYLGNSDLKKELETKILLLESELKTNDEIIKKIEKRNINVIAMREEGEITKDEFLSRRAVIANEETEATNKYNLISKELFELRKLLARQDDKQATVQMLIDAKDNRAELKSIFNQFISRVIINKLDAKTVLASVFISIAGQELPQPLKLFLNIRGLINKPIKYQYVPYYKMASDPIYKNNILLVDTDEILEELQATMNIYDAIVDKMHHSLITIKKENLVLIEDKYPIQ
ncbi:MAG: recombinase family protein [Flavobacterium nitrogenifigens]|uniref:recombinase family protein n=1 Tax=Flavobacterium nitrogenifigens TaxID=1617283 RepID=UPI0028075068|nr:recombinase family protein [Flavobacterium nitrogenifigens]MDQ8012970.1 recombinase family protein [Flavobacterium nitrogenifigens]